MVKPYFTRKNLIVIALTFFYAMLIVFSGVCIDGAHTIIPKGNIINILGQQLGFQVIEAGVAGFVSLILIAIYMLVFIAAFLYMRRYAIINGKKPFGIKMIVIYLLIAILCLVLSVGVGLVIQTNLKRSLLALVKFSITAWVCNELKL